MVQERFLKTASVSFIIVVVLGIGYVVYQYIRPVPPVDDFGTVADDRRKDVDQEDTDDNKRTTHTQTMADNNVIKETRRLLISLGRLPSNSTDNDVRDYVTPPLRGRPFIYYCGTNFVLQYVGGEYHKLEYYSSSFRKTNECEATFAIGSAQPYPASCSVASACIPVRDVIYPLTLKTDKASYQYGDEIILTLAGNENRNESVELVGLVSPYCAGLHLERIGKSSQNWIRDSVTRPGGGSGAGCPHRITVSPDSPYEIKIRIDDAGTVPPGKWRVVHESEYASLTAGFWLEPLNQEQFGCHVSGGTYVGCPESGGTGLCFPCTCPEGTSWLRTEKQCIRD